jgi:hypothetical protein
MPDLGEKPAARLGSIFVALQSLDTTRNLLYLPAFLLKAIKT